MRLSRERCRSSNRWRRLVIAATGLLQQSSCLGTVLCHLAHASRAQTNGPSEKVTQIRRTLDIWGGRRCFGYLCRDEELAS